MGLQSVKAKGKIDFIRIHQFRLSRDTHLLDRKASQTHNYGASIALMVYMSVEVPYPDVALMRQTY